MRRWMGWSQVRYASKDQIIKKKSQQDLDEATFTGQSTTRDKISNALYTSMNFGDINATDVTAKVNLAATTTLTATSTTASSSSSTTTSDALRQIDLADLEINKTSNNTSDRVLLDRSLLNSFGGNNSSFEEDTLVSSFGSADSQRQSRNEKDKLAPETGSLLSLVSYEKQKQYLQHQQQSFRRLQTPSTESVGAGLNLIPGSGNKIKNVRIGQGQGPSTNASSFKTLTTEVKNGASDIFVESKPLYPSIGGGAGFKSISGDRNLDGGVRNSPFNEKSAQSHFAGLSATTSHGSDSDHVTSGIGGPQQP